MSRPPDRQYERDVVTKTRPKAKLKRPELYRVLLHNDDFTPREFVVAVLEAVFAYNEATATQLMLAIEQAGKGIAGIYAFEIAETKVAQVLAAAEKAEFPLLCTMEPEETGDDA